LIITSPRLLHEVCMTWRYWLHTLFPF
jgi:hypothetical protein